MAYDLTCKKKKFDLVSSRPPKMEWGIMTEIITDRLD